MKNPGLKPVVGLFVLAFSVFLLVYSCGSHSPMTEQEKVERGRYLVSIGGCGDCHSPKVIKGMGPQEDQSRLLSGHPATEQLPEMPQGALTMTGWVAATNMSLTAWLGPWGISYAANLTPDEVTGIGAWTEKAFINAIRNGKHLGTGRPILPPMPWQNYARMTDEDLGAIFAYLKSLPPVRNQVPQPVSMEELTLNR
jgi:mono/diheme cytochrome c family protein